MKWLHDRYGHYVSSQVSSQINQVSTNPKARRSCYNQLCPRQHRTKSSQPRDGEKQSERKKERERERNNKHTRRENEKLTETEKQTWYDWIQQLLHLLELLAPHGWLSLASSQLINLRNIEIYRTVDTAISLLQCASRLNDTRICDTFNLS